MNRRQRKNENKQRKIETAVAKAAKKVNKTHHRHNAPPQIEETTGRGFEKPLLQPPQKSISKLEIDWKNISTNFENENNLLLKLHTYAIWYYELGYKTFEHNSRIESRIRLLEEEKVMLQQKKEIYYGQLKKHNERYALQLELEVVTDKVSSHLHVEENIKNIKEQIDFITIQIETEKKKLVTDEKKKQCRELLKNMKAEYDNTRRMIENMSIKYTMMREIWKMNEYKEQYKSYADAHSLNFEEQDLETYDAINQHYVANAHPDMDESAEGVCKAIEALGMDVRELYTHNLREPKYMNMSMGPFEEFCFDYPADKVMKIQRAKVIRYTELSYYDIVTGKCPYTIVPLYDYDLLQRLREEK